MHDALLHPRAAQNENPEGRIRPGVHGGIGMARSLTRANSASGYLTSSKSGSHLRKKTAIVSLSFRLRQRAAKGGSHLYRFVATTEAAHNLTTANALDRKTKLVEHVESDVHEYEITLTELIGPESDAEIFSPR